MESNVEIKAQTESAFSTEPFLDILIVEDNLADVIIVRELLRKYTHQFSILSSATEALSRCDDIQSSFRIICDNISLLLDNANALVVEFESSALVRVSCIEWLVPWYAEIKKFTGFDYKNPVIHIKRGKREMIDLFSDGKLHEIKRGLYEIFEGNIGRNECIELERITGINHIYAFGIIKTKNFYGTGVIFSQKIITGDDLNVIETIVSQAALYIHRRYIEKDLRLSEYRFRKLNKELENKVTERTLDFEKANKKLQKELGERTRAEKALKESEVKLKELNATKDKFFNIVAHDLKNPFTSLIGSSELLSANIRQLDKKSIYELAMILNDSARSGYAILQNLLDWSMSQTGLLKYNPEKIDLNKLIDENISAIRLLASNKDIYLGHELNERTYIVSDSLMINTILRNLLSNAIKFTHRGGKVLINTYINQDETIISVKDTGTGISAENIEKLFNLDTIHTINGTENEQGTSLGIKLSKEFV